MTLNINNLVYCVIDTNDRFKFVTEDPHSSCDIEVNLDTGIKTCIICRETSSENKEDVSWLQKGVDFNSCRNNGRNYVFLELTPEGLVYNNRVVFTNNDLKNFSAVIESKEPKGPWSQVLTEPELANKEFEDDDNELDGDELDNDNEERNYTINGSVHYDKEGNIRVTSKKYKCSCFKCKYQKEWFNNNNKYIFSSCFINSKDHSTTDLIKESIEFMEDGDIIHVGRLGANVALYFPYTSDNLSLWIYSDILDINPSLI